MLFDKKFIASVEEEPISGVVNACDRAFSAMNEVSTGPEWSEAEHEVLWEASSFVELIMDANGIEPGFRMPNPQESIEKNCISLHTHLRALRDKFYSESTKLKADIYKNRYKGLIKSSFAYEFSQGDLERVQILVNELRTQITNCDLLEPDHKRRLLKRLEHMQSELHKRVSDLDRFWGLVGEAGVVLNKLGNDAKPIVDRIREIAQITWKTQARTEELPSGAANPMLEHHGD